MSTGRERSFWGWGYADKFPDEDGRAAVAQHATGLLGLEGLQPQPLPTLENISLPAPRVSPPETLGVECSADRRERALHTYGRSYRDLIRGFRGDFSAAPDLLFFPDSAASRTITCVRPMTSVYFGGPKP